MIRRIRPDQVRLGMYVRGIGGSFVSHPFWRTRFELTLQADVDRLRACRVPYVEIDEALGCGPLPDAELSPRSDVYLVDHIGQNLRDPSRQAARRSARPAMSARSVEHDHAVRTVARAKSFVSELFNTARLGGDVPVAQAIELVEEIDAMFEQGNHLLFDVVRMKTADEYTYLHSVAVCALMLKLARQIDLPGDQVRDCGLAGLLHDVGKMRIPLEVLHKREALSDAEFGAIKSHAYEGYLILRDVEGLPGAAVDVAHLHHEKIDGSGYPLGLTGEQIPQVARMGAICDVYDALTSNRAYKAAWTPAVAIETMISSTGHFDVELLDAFAQSIGLMPPAETQDLSHEARRGIGASS